MLGIVIPTLNEEGTLPLLLEDLARLSWPFRIMVADGGSTDQTREVGMRGGARIIEAPQGRARQMNAGAAALDTPWLLFLHADIRMPDRSMKAMEGWLAHANPVEFATFSFSLEGEHWFWRFIELGQGIRERTSGLAYGDQGLLVSQALFQEVGGFPDLPLMEDVELLRLLKRKGRWTKIPEPVLASPRRYREEGRWRGWLRNTALITLYMAGVPARRLAAFYPTRRAAGPPAPPNSPAPVFPGENQSPEGQGPPTAPVPVSQERILLIFAKEPRPGQVKTRLAAEIGADEAARIYQEMGKRIVDQLRGGGYRSIVCFDPPDAFSALADWLGPQGLEFLPQVEGGLGTRLEAAFREGFGRATAVVVVGTDAPDVDSEVVEEAFRKLKEADLVLGPATDGGYYLLGLRSEAPELFQQIPWSTPAVLAATLERAKTLGLSIATLPPLPDVDTLEDLEALAPDNQ